MPACDAHLFAAAVSLDRPCFPRGGGIDRSPDGLVRGDDCLMLGCSAFRASAGADVRRSRSFRGELVFRPVARVQRKHERLWIGS